MIKEKIEQIKSLIQNNTPEDNKKKIENLVVFLVLLIIVIIAINVIWNEDKIDSNDDTNYKQLAYEQIESNNKTTEVNYNLEEKLENILSKISGVGKVNVLLTYYETSEVIAMYNESYNESTTQETDTSGGTRTIKETDNKKDIIYQEENGNKVPITQKTILPKIEGAMIIAEGASNSNIQANIIQGVEAVTGLPTHKIQVFEMGE